MIDNNTIFPFRICRRNIETNISKEVLSFMTLDWAIESLPHRDKLNFYWIEEFKNGNWIETGYHS